ncbi:hypothetical protein AAG570_012044 [Ranatra chinensis]|uniref:Uncharacterized protein n=1 Tax=Ranatra chinensis TaxID=642074 RepID=A0ABD0YHN9_9HEMI
MLNASKHSIMTESFPLDKESSIPDSRPIILYLSCTAITRSRPEICSVSLAIVFVLVNSAVSGPQGVTDGRTPGYNVVHSPFGTSYYTLQNGAPQFDFYASGHRLPYTPQEVRRDEGGPRNTAGPTDDGGSQQTYMRISARREPAPVVEDQSSDLPPAHFNQPFILPYFHHYTFYHL